MHFLDLRQTSASSRRPVFANPRLRRDLNLRKIDQSKHDPTVKCAVLEAGYVREATRIFKEGLEKCLALSQLHVRLKCTLGN